MGVAENLRSAAGDRSGCDSLNQAVTLPLVTVMLGLPLLDRGASIDQIVPGDENALIQASAEGHLEVVKLLVARGADVNARVFVDPTSQHPNGEWRTPPRLLRAERLLLCDVLPVEPC